VAWVAKTQGRHGEVAVEVHSDALGRFEPGQRLFASPDAGARRELQIEAVRPHKQWLALKFGGVNSIADAEALIGCELQVPRGERGQLEAGWTYVSDLTGCAVYDDAREVGVVEDIQFGAGEAPLLILKAGSQRREVPFAEAYLKRVDVAQKRIEMVLPEGLLEVNAPLTEEEKREQASRKTESGAEP
jgi:16S rRNA processing protein RimM